MHRLVEFSLKYRFLIIVMTLLVIGVGFYDLRRLPIDAVPDITPNQVLIITRVTGLGPVEVERFITFPVETSMNGLPGIQSIRSTSRFGLSVVYVFFDESMDIYFARRLVMERLPQAREMIPAGYGTPTMGPISTGLGEIYQFQVKGPGRSVMELRSILDWDIAFKLRSVPGVVEVNTFGGELKTYELQLNAEKLVGYKLSLQRVLEALQQNNSATGGGYIEHNQEQQVIRGEGLIENLDNVGNIVVAATPEGTPIYIKNLGDVRFAPLVRQGAVTRDGNGEIVTGVVMMLIGENSRAVAQRVKTALTKIQASLPSGVTIDSYYDRTDLVNQTIHTVSKNLIEGGLLVIAVLLLLLGNLKGGLIVALAIPLSMLAAFTGMVYAKLSGNLMSLGAIDFGLIVDGSVVMIENIVRKLGERKPGDSTDVNHTILEAGREVARPVFFAVLIIIVVYIPILSLQGVEGKMFRPMALTVIFALFASLVLSLTLMPTLASFVFRRVREKETWLIRKAHQVYLPLLQRAMRRPLLIVGIAAGIFAVSVLIALRMGAQFIPRLEEGTIAVQAWRLPSVALSQSVQDTTLIERTLKQFPEVRTVVSRTGQAEIPTDPMGPEMSDIYAILKPREEWTSAETQDDLISKIDAALKKNVAGDIFSYSQPIELRMQELIAGVRSDISIALYGDDLATLKKEADEIVRVVSQIPGAADTKAEQTTGLPYLRIRVDRDAIARYGINASQVLDVVQAMGGKEVGQVLEGQQRRFAMQVRFQPQDRASVDRIRSIKVADPEGRLIPLSQLASISVEDGPAQISREKIQRRIMVETNVRGRDIASFVSAAQRAVSEKVKLPSGYTLEWGGQFKNLQEATSRLVIVVPLALFLIFVILYTIFNSARLGLLIYINVPIAATGGVFALWLRGLPFSISAAVGFIALFGVAVLNGVVLVSYINQMRLNGMSPHDAAVHGAEIRLRPVLMTALVASLGFIPMALGHGAGAEVQRPLATVVIGGLITSTLLTLVMLPAIYPWFEKERPDIEL